jgi:hypothetical protein
MIASDPIWRTFQSVSSAAEAAAYAHSCIFSLATLEIACSPGATPYALTEQEQPGVWRWAVVDEMGRVIHDGWEPTQAGAKLASAHVLQRAG